MMGNDIASQRLRNEMEALLDRRGVRYGTGPAGAHFDAVLGVDRHERRFEYIAYTANGPKASGGPRSAGCEEFPEFVRRSLATFEAALTTGTLLWRAVPEAERRDDGWHAYWRCVQLGDDYVSFFVRWNV